MAFSAGEIAGFIGAAAWAPQIIKWGISYFSIPNVLVIPERVSEVGYSTLGPIINLRLAISTDSKDVLLNDFKASLTHEDGEKRILTWQGTTETFSQIRDYSGASQVVEKDETGIAVKVKIDGLTDKKFRFQDDVFHENIKFVSSEAIKHENYLKSKQKDYHQELLDSEKVHDFIEAFKSGFWWKSGEYTIEFDAACLNESINLDRSKYVFHLSQQDVDRLKINLSLFRGYIEWYIMKELDGFEKPMPIFQWVNPKVSKK